MKAYGLPRDQDREYPDKADILHFATPSRVGKLRGKGGEFRSSFKRSAVKRATRRNWKKKERRKGKLEAKTEEI